VPAGRWPRRSGPKSRHRIQQFALQAHYVLRAWLIVIDGLSTVGVVNGHTLFLDFGRTLSRMEKSLIVVDHNGTKTLDHPQNARSYRPMASREGEQIGHALSREGRGALAQKPLAPRPSPAGWAR